jgi:transposase-like protein
MSATAQQPATVLVPGRDFPRNYAELRRWFPDDGAYLDYLGWLRWPEGFVCPRCGGGGSRLEDGRHWCEPCHRRVSVTPNAKTVSLDPFLRDSIEPSSTVVTDGLKSYPPAVGSDYVHCPVNVARSGVQAHVLLPGVHRIASLAQRWLLGIHQGAVEGDHLQAYLDEFAFRFNRRQSAFRGLLFRRLLEQGVPVGPVSYHSLVVNSVPKSKPPLPPGGSHRVWATSLTAALTPITHPWRAYNG